MEFWFFQATKFQTKIRTPNSWFINPQLDSDRSYGFLVISSNNTSKRIYIMIVLKQSLHMWLMSQRNPCEMQHCCQCTFLKHFSITKHILAKKKFFIVAIFLKWRFFLLSKSKEKKICVYCSRGFVCCSGKNIWSQIWWGTSKAFIWDQFYWSEMVLRCSRVKKWIKTDQNWTKKFQKL